MNEVIPEGRFVEEATEVVTETGPMASANSNPFAATQSEHISVGAVAIETSRGIAEVQGRMILAKRFPRDTALAYTRTMTACQRIGLAEEGLYKYTRGGKKVEGPSIRLAEEMARCWGNIEYGLNELSRRSGESEMEAYAWDLETNTRSSQRFTVRHIRERGEGNKTLDGERDIYEISANMGARRMRSRIIAILPPELVRDASAACRETMKNGGGIPFDDRIKRMLSSFNSIGATPPMIADFVGHPIDRITPDELADLRGILQSIKDDQSTVAEHFGHRGKPRPANVVELTAALSGKTPDTTPLSHAAADLITEINAEESAMDLTAWEANGLVRAARDALSPAERSAVAKAVQAAFMRLAPNEKA